MILYPESIPIFLKRIYNNQYTINQKRILEKTNAHIIENNIELLRLEYKNKDGFNAGNGYFSLLIPYITKYKANILLGGAIFDEIGFDYEFDISYGNPPSLTARTLNTIKYFKNAGIHLCYPISGLSESRR